MGFDGCRWRNWANVIVFLVNMFVTYVSLTGVFGPNNKTLSAKYQTLVTPAGWAFSIWGVIFIWEAIFCVAQASTSALRTSVVVEAVTPWWIAACVSQSLWTPLFAQEIIWGSLLAMLAILASLMGLIICADRHLSLTPQEFWLLRAPFSVHAGWILAASFVNANVFFDFLRASPGVLVTAGVLSLILFLVIIVVYQFLAPKRDAIICFVAAWACIAIFSELSNPALLNSPTRYNPHVFSESTTEQLRIAACCVSVAALLSGVWAAFTRNGTKGRVRDSADALSGAPRSQLRASLLHPAGV